MSRSGLARSMKKAWMLISVLVLAGCASPSRVSPPADDRRLDPAAVQSDSPARAVVTKAPAGPVLEVLPGHSWSWRLSAVAALTKAEHGTATYNGQIRNISGRSLRVQVVLTCYDEDKKAVASGSADVAARRSSASPGTAVPTPEGTLSPNETRGFSVTAQHSSQPPTCGIEFFGIPEGKLSVRFPT